MDLPNVRIYVLCHNAERLEMAKRFYVKYYWAHPILMKYQDSTFENTFWRQLLEIKDEWEQCEMVGAIASSAFMKISLDKIDSIIRNLRVKPTGYYPFKAITPIYYGGHPHCKKIVYDICETLALPDPKIGVYCNYWMCRPKYMVGFIEWYHSVLLPAVIAHPLINTDAKYPGKLTATELQNLCNVPYYPHTPFVIERLNAVYFLNALYAKGVDKT